MLTLKELQSLRDFKSFNPINISGCETIVDVEAFVDSHLSFLENNSGNRAYMPYYNRLVKLYELWKQSTQQ